MTRQVGRSGQGLLACIILALTVAPVLAAGYPYDAAVRYLLATASAFRTVYSKAIVEQADKVGVTPMERWADEPHGIMLPAQFVKAAGAEIKEFDLSLVGLTPIYRANLPKTDAETEALKKMMANPDLKLVTFPDGKQYKGLAADYAIVQACADCHNQHPQSPRRDFKQGDLMGAIVIRLDLK